MKYSYSNYAEPQFQPRYSTPVRKLGFNNTGGIRTAFSPGPEQDEIAEPESLDLFSSGNKEKDENSWSIVNVLEGN